MRALIAAAVAVAALPSAGLAEPPPAEIIVTGTRLEVAPDALPAPATVIDRAEIEAGGDSALPDLLRRVPGLQVSQPGAGGITQVFLRGSEPNFVVVLLDGIRMNDPNNTRGGSFDLASLNLADIERIEIVRGSQSSIYGSDALAGVIQIISHAPTDRLAAVAPAEAGGESYSQLGARVAGPVGFGQASLSAAHRDDGEATAGSRYETDTLSARWRSPAGEHWDGGLHLNFSDSEATSFPEQSGGPERAVLRTLDERSSRDLTFGGDLRLAFNDELALIGRLTRFDRRDEYDSPGIAPGDFVPPNGARNELERDQVAIRLAYTGAAAWQGSIGFDFEQESGESRGYIELAPEVRVPADFALDRDTWGAFVEGRWRASEIFALQASARHDAPDTADNQTTGQLGGVLSFNEGATEWRANLGRGFKLPSFFALGNPLIGDRNLKPEKSRNADAGVHQQLGDAASIDVVLFHNEYEDLIDFDPETFRSVNRDRVTTRGVEFGADWRLQPALATRLHATWTDIDVKGSARELLQRPEWRAGAGIRWQPRDTWLVDLDWLYVGDVLDAVVTDSGSVQERLDDYHRVDISARWQATQRLGVSLAIDNLLDADYQEAIGFPAAGVRPRLGVTWRYGE